MRNHEVVDVPPDRVLEVTGKAGTVIVFDTSGIHRQGVPMLEPRRAVFLDYHHPDLPLQTDDIAYYRYHPLLLDAVFLGGLMEEDRHILGFGDKTHYQEQFERAARHRGFQRLSSRLFDGKLLLSPWKGRVVGRLRRLLGRR